MKKVQDSISQQFLAGFFDRMSDVIRYSGTKILNKENLAEHSYYVSVLADALAEDFEFRFGVQLDRYKILKYALYHDIEEIFTGDIVSPVKYKSDELRIKFEEVGNMMLTEQLDIHFSWNKHIAEMILNAHNEYEAHKTDVLENQLVKFADILQAISYTMSETKLWNTYLKGINTNFLKLLKEKYLDKPYFKFYAKEIIPYLRKHI